MMSKYKCTKCGYEFESRFVARVIGNILAIKPTVFVDPAPSPYSIFSSPKCPRCHSKTKKIN